MNKKKTMNICLYTSVFIFNGQKKNEEEKIRRQNIFFYFVRIFTI